MGSQEEGESAAEWGRQVNLNSHSLIRFHNRGLEVAACSGSHCQSDPDTQVLSASQGARRNQKGDGWAKGESLQDPTGRREWRRVIKSQRWFRTTSPAIQVSPVPIKGVPWELLAFILKTLAGLTAFLETCRELVQNWFTIHTMKPPLHLGRSPFLTQNSPNKYHT